ncbi:hypothetical protein [Fusobacterium nucleatum]|uniref:hypothetical protein n=1 Tax=Fusobacterium nucleatum TaxID=851 RepID=UPI0030B34165
MEIKMRIDSKSFVLNTLSQDSSWITNKKIFYTLGLQLTQLLVYLIEQYKYFENNNLLREDGSFYVSNIDLQVYNTMNESLIKTLKKRGIEEGIFRISLEGIPLKSYYYLDFDKIAEIATIDKTNSELAYEYFKKTTGTDIELQINNEEDILSLNKLSYKELRFYCKKNNITYTGKHKTKNSLIELILNKQCPELVKADFSTVDEISAHNQDINKTCNICHVHGEKNKKEKDTEIEKIFHELGINYTDTNEKNCLLVLNEFNGDKILLERYLISIYKQLGRLTNIKNLAALFSKKLKEINFSLINKIKNENKDNSEKIKEEQERIEAEKKALENINRQEKIIDYFINLDESIQKDIVNLAEQDYLKEMPNINTEMLQIYKKSSYRVYLKMIYSKLSNILKIEYPELLERK